MLLRWGITPQRMWQTLLLFVLAAMVSLNVWLFKKLRKTMREGKAGGSGKSETVMDWSQNLDEVEIDIPLPRADTKRGDVECKITARSIRFAFRGDEQPMLDGTLLKKVKVDECNWQFWPVGQEATHIKISLVKENSTKWKSLLKTDATGTLQVDEDSSSSRASKGKAKKA